MKLYISIPANKSTFLAVACSLVLARAGSQVFTINISTGNGLIGQRDSLILVQGSSWSTVPNSGLSLESPFVVSTPSYWADYGIPAHWVSPTAAGYGAPGGYEYFVDFTLPQNVTNVTLSISWRADDVENALLNGTKYSNLDGSTGPGGFNNVPATFTGDVTALVNLGTNELSFQVNNANPGGDNPTGLQFAATIGYEVAQVPEPTALELASLLTMSFWLPWRRFNGKPTRGLRRSLALERRQPAKAQSARLKPGEEGHTTLHP
jgi:hypothetical protein